MKINKKWETGTDIRYTRLSKESIKQPWRLKWRERGKSRRIIISFCESGIIKASRGMKTRLRWKSQSESADKGWSSLPDKNTLPRPRTKKCRWRVSECMGALWAESGCADCSSRGIYGFCLKLIQTSMFLAPFRQVLQAWRHHLREEEMHQEYRLASAHNPANEMGSLPSKQPEQSKLNTCQLITKVGKEQQGRKIQ